MKDRLQPPHPPQHFPDLHPISDAILRIYLDFSRHVIHIKRRRLQRRVHHNLERNREILFQVLEKRPRSPVLHFQQCHPRDRKTMAS